MLFYLELPYFLKDKLFFYIFFRFLNGKPLSLDSELYSKVTSYFLLFYLGSTDGYGWPEKMFIFKYL